MLGMFALNPVGITGSIVQQLNHGISTGALFLLVGVVYERRHTREISEYGGLSKVMPVYAAVFLVMTMSSIGLPTLNGFIGEFLILQGVFVASKMWAAFAASGVVLGAAYMLYLYQRTMFGKVENPKNERLLDLSHREFATFAPLLVLAVWMGLYPAPFLRRLETLGAAHRAARQPAIPTPAHVRRVRDATPERLARRRRATRRRRFLDAVPCDANGNPLAAAETSASDAARNFASRLLLHPAGAGAHGRRAARAGRRRPACRAAAARAARLGHARACSARPSCRSAAVRRSTTHVEVAHGLLAVDQFALFFKIVFLVAAAITVLMSMRYLAIEGAIAGRVLLPDPVRHARHDDHGRRHRSHHHLHRPRDDGGVVLHPGRASSSRTSDRTKRR